VRVERTGAERRVSSALARNIPATSRRRRRELFRRRAFHCLEARRHFAPYVPETSRNSIPAEHKDADGQFASFRVWLSIIAYNTNLVKAEEAPKSFADLLDPNGRARS